MGPLGLSITSPAGKSDTLPLMNNRAKIHASDFGTALECFISGMRRGNPPPCDRVFEFDPGCRSGLDTRPEASYQPELWGDIGAIA